MTNNLSKVKTIRTGLTGGLIHGTQDGMEREERPFADIADRIVWHREDVEGMTQNEYADSIRVSRQTLNNWESGNYRLSIDGALALRRKYGLSLDFMYEGIDDALPMTLRRAWRERP